MQVITNERLVKTRRRIGWLATVVGFGTLLGGLALSWGGDERVILAYITLVPGFLLISYGNYNTIRWGTNPRIDQVIANAIKTFDSRWSLYNYVPALPVDSLLLSPGGLTVLEPRPYFGTFSISGSKWNRKRNLLGWLLIFGEGGLGNPTKDAQKDVEQTRQFLADNLGSELAQSVPIDSLIVFTHPRTTLIVENPDVPVIYASDLKGALRKPAGASKLPADQYRQIARLLRDSSAELTTTSTTPSQPGQTGQTRAFRKVRKGQSN